MERQIKAFQKTLTQSYDWIQALCESYDYSDENDAFVLLRATLKSLRDRIPSDEAQHLGSQLPALIRGFYFEGWDTHKDPLKDRTADAFLASVRRHLNGHDNIDLEMAVPEALRVIFEKIDKGEAEEVIHALPKEVQEMCS